MPKRGKRGNGWKQNKTRKTSSDNAICASKKSINKKCYEKSKKKQEKNQIKTIQTNKRIVLRIPIIKECLDTMKLVIQTHWNSPQMIGFALCLFSVSESIVVNVIENKFESQYALGLLCDIGGMMNRITRNNRIDIQEFAQGSELILGQKRYVFADKYYHYLFTISLEEFCKYLQQLKGVYHVSYHDMVDRFNKQCHNPPKSMLTTNDRCESMQGSAKYYQHIKQRLSELSRGVRVLGDINKDMWYTFDWMREHNFDEFCRLLIFWLYSCGTYREKRECEKKKQAEYNQTITGNTMNRIKQTTNAIPQVPSHLRISTKTFKPPITIEFEHIDCVLWNRWCVIRNDLINKMTGSKVTLVRGQLLTQFNELIANNKESLHGLTLNARWKIRKRQDVFYEYCAKMLGKETTNNSNNK
eukprot:483596_1